MLPYVDGAGECGGFCGGVEAGKAGAGDGLPD